MTAGALFDQLIITGIAFLDGTLHANAINAYKFSQGNSLKVLKYASNNTTSIPNFSGLNIAPGIASTHAHNPADLTLKMGRPIRDQSENPAGLLHCI